MIRTDLINNLLIDPGLQENQLTAVEQTIVQNGYPGVVIDYRGVDAVPSARADFVHLIYETGGSAARQQQDVGGARGGAPPDFRRYVGYAWL